MSTRALVGIGAAVMTTAALMPGAAQAETSYRYWSYWIGGDTWTYSARGPGFRTPLDAGVEGYRFVVSPKDGSQASPPAGGSTYEQLCPGQPTAPEGQKRVAVVLDFGPAGIAPVGETPPATSVQCVVVDQGATGLQVLQKVAQLRFNSSGLICGIAGFPATECPGQTTRTASPTPTLAPSAAASTPAAAPVPMQSTVPLESSVPTSASLSPSATPSQTPTSAPLPTTAPSAVALSVDTAAPTNTDPQTPAWIAAIGVTMIAALLGLALLARRGREE